MKTWTKRVPLKLNNKTYAVCTRCFTGMYNSDEKQNKKKGKKSHQINYNDNPLIFIWAKIDF